MQPPFARRGRSALYGLKRGLSPKLIPLADRLVALSRLAVLRRTMREVIAIIREIRS